MSIQEFGVLVKQTFQSWNEDKAARLAAALSFYAVFSMAPVLVIALAVAGQVIDRAEVEAQALQQIKDLIGPQGASFIQTVLENVRKPTDSALASILGLVTLIFGAAGAFGQLQDALNTIWEVQARAGEGLGRLVRDKFLSFVMVVVTGFLLLISLISSTVISALGGPLSGFTSQSATVLQIINLVVSFGIIALTFAVILKVIPDVHLRWRDVWPGALMSALLFTVGKYAIGLYLAHSSISSSYGAAGSVIIILIWVYYSAQIFFVGAEFTKMYARKRGSPVRPTDRAKTVTEEARAHEGIPHAGQSEQHS